MLDKELDRYNLDDVLFEIQLSNDGQIEEPGSGYIFFYKRRLENECQS